jgi:hypothetical protein
LAAIRAPSISSLANVRIRSFFRAALGRTATLERKLDRLDPVCGPRTAKHAIVRVAAERTLVHLPAHLFANQLNFAVLTAPNLPQPAT